MANYYISDLHIGHENILSFDSRPFADTKEMYSVLLTNWNRRITAEDTVYILGDFIWAKGNEWPEYVRAFNGNKVLIRGNHDPKGFSPETRELFQDVRDYMELTDNERHVVLCHYPIPFFHADFWPEVFMLYGHVHNTLEYKYLKKLRAEILANAKGNAPNGNFINVGCMMPYMDYTPRTLEEIIAGDAKYRENGE